MNLLDSDLLFKHILDLSKVYDEDNHGPKISFRIVNENFIAANNGIYIIVQGQEREIMYCGMCGTRSFRNSLLFNKTDDLHFHNQERIRSLIGAAIGEGIEVHAQTEEVLRRHLASQSVSPANLKTLNSIKKVIIDRTDPPWNRKA